MLKKLFVVVVLLTSNFERSAQADLIAGWDFQTTATGGTAAVASATGSPSPFLYNANFGSGTLFLNGTNGSSTWVSGVSNPEVTAFGGTAVNAGAGFSTTTTGAASLALANLSANGKFAVFSFNMSGFQNLNITYASQKSGTGFGSQVWEFSTDATNWTAAGTNSTIPTAFGALSVPTISGLNNVSTAFLRLTVSGATAAAGNNRLDNIQFNAATISAIPEPTSMALVGIVGLTGMAGAYRRRKAKLVIA
jgi:hypothetical protein